MLELGFNTKQMALHGSSSSADQSQNPLHLGSSFSITIGTDKLEGETKCDGEIVEKATTLKTAGGCRSLAASRWVV